MTRSFKRKIELDLIALIDGIDIINTLIQPEKHYNSMALSSISINSSSI